MEPLELNKGKKIGYVGLIIISIGLISVSAVIVGISAAGFELSQQGHYWTNLLIIPNVILTILGICFIWEWSEKYE